MSEENDTNKKEKNNNENKEEENKKKKKKKKKTVKLEEKTEKENESPEAGYNKDITNKNYKEDDNIKDLNQEALSNIPSKEMPKKKKKKKEEEQKEENQKEEKNENKEMDINDILNSNNANNNGELMITELLDVDGDKKKKKKKNKKKDKEKENNENNNDENIKEEINEKPIQPIDESNIYLQDKFKSLEVPESLKSGINEGISKSNEEIKEDIKNHKITISNKTLKSSDLLNFNKSLENILYGNKKVFLTDVDKYLTKENLKNLKFLKGEEKAVWKNIEKLNQNQKVIEDTMPLESNVIENNIRKSQLKNINKTKDELMLRLEKINQKINILLSEEKLRQKNNNRQNLTTIKTNIK